MSKRRALQRNTYFYVDDEDASLPDDPEHWTILHDLCTLLLHFNVLRDDEFDDVDKFFFQIYIPNWKFDFGGNRFGLKHGNPENVFDLLDEVDHELFQPSESLTPYLPRVAKSHANIVEYFEDGQLYEDTLKGVLWDIYRATYAHVYLTHSQKLRLKEYLLFWNQLFDLSHLIEVVDYHFEDGIKVFSCLDNPDFELPRTGRF